MKKKFNQGFTLIELLVVIAIIGILASVILASLNTARAKGTDAATISDLSNSRAQAELFYDNANTYTGVCSTAGTANGIQTIMLDAAAKIGGAVTYSTVGSSYTTVTCNVAANGSAWAATVPMKSIGTAAAPVYFCADSTGAAKKGTTAAPENLSAGTITQCP